MEGVALGGGLDVKVARHAVDHDVSANHAAWPLVVVNPVLLRRSSRTPSPVVLQRLLQYRVTITKHAVLLQQCTPR